MTQHRSASPIGGPTHGRNLGRAGSLERDHANARVWQHAEAQFTVMTREGDDREQARVSGANGDGRSADPAGKALRRRKARRATAFCGALNKPRRGTDCRQDRP